MATTTAGRVVRVHHQPRWLLRLVHTTDELAPFVARVMLGLVMLPHAAQKAFGWFGGYGPAGTMRGFVHMGVPAPLAVLAITAEIMGSIGLVLGLFSRVAAFGIACVMFGAIFLIHLDVGFFMNWTGQQRGEGLEYHLLAIALAAIVMLKGGGGGSVDRAIERALDGSRA